MDTRFLESFICVADCGSMAEAARRLGLTPAAVAQRIRALEGEVGAPLLTRSGRTVQPTPSGAAILAKARGLLQEVRDLRTLATGDAITGELRLGAISTAITGILPDVLARLTGRYPQFQLYVMPGNSIGLYEQVQAGNLDAALMVEPPFALPKACQWHVLRQEPLVVLAPASAASRDPLELLATEPFIRYDRNHWGGRLADGRLRQHGIRPRERFELDALEAIAVLVDRGLGVSLVPDWAPPWPEGLSLVKLRLPPPDTPRRIGLLWLRTSMRLRLIRALLDEATGLPAQSAASDLAGADLAGTG